MRNNQAVKNENDRREKVGQPHTGQGPSPPFAYRCRSDFITAKIRKLLFLLAAVPFGVLLLAALIRLPGFGRYSGPYGDLVMQTVNDLRHTPQGVAAVTFDYRGFDTLGEEFILFAAVSGVLLLMRKQRDEHQQAPVDRSKDRIKVSPPSALVRAAGLFMFPLTLLLGCSIVFHGHLTPGGGFQGGVLLASGFLFVYLSGELEDLAGFVPDHLLDLLEAGGAGSFVVLAMVPLLMQLELATNILPLGTSGSLLSAGNIPVCNLAVGLEVAAGFLLVIISFISQALMIRRKGRT